MAYRRRNRFGHNTPPKPAVVEQAKPCPYKRHRCAGCKLYILLGDPAVRLKLRRQYRVPCGTCNQPPKGSRWFHAACKPVDVNKVMGYNPNPPAVAPPPKPQSAAELQFAALVATETALKRRLAENPRLAENKELEKTLQTYNKLKGLALRPGNDAEGLAALKQAMKRAIDLVL